MLCCAIDIIHSGETVSVKKDVKMPVQGGICCDVMHHLQHYSYVLTDGATSHC